MMNNIMQNSCHIKCHVDKQESRPVVPGMTVDEKLANTKQKIQMLKSKQEIFISTFNVQTLNRTAKSNELVCNAQKFNISVITIQEHRLVHEEPLKHHSLGENWLLITSSATQNTLNAAIGGAGILLNPHANLALESIENISERTMLATSNGNPKYTVISTYSPTNVTSEDTIQEYYSELTTLIQCRDINAQVGLISEKHYHQTNNRKGELQHSTNLINFCTKFQKIPGKKWSFMYTSGAKAQLDHILLNKKWKNSAIDCATYNNFDSVSLDHKIVTIKCRLCLRANKSIKYSPKFD